MGEPRYTVEYDDQLRTYRWQIEPGYRLSPPNGQPLTPALRVVAMGGGTGLPILLQGLKATLFPPGPRWIRARDRDRLTAIVTAADDGGSSGRLRNAYGVLPPGDIRNCLLALSDGSAGLADLFNFRFPGDGDVAGHSLGNLILVAFSQLEGGFLGAVERGAEMLGSRGRALPSTLDEVTLVAQFAYGSPVEGESRIAPARRPIRQVALRPEDARALPLAREAVARADLLVIGPGSLYTSLIPVVLVRELAEAVAQSHARVVLVMNLMTEPGETDGYGAAEHLLAIRRHAPQVPIHDVLLNTRPIPDELLERYAAGGAVPVPMDPESVRILGPRPVTRDLLGVGGPKIHHDPLKLARAVLDLTSGRP